MRLGRPDGGERLQKLLQDDAPQVLKLGHRLSREDQHVLQERCATLALVAKSSTNQALEKTNKCFVAEIQNLYQTHIELVGNRLA